jgi:hypothetical protein
VILLINGYFRQKEYFENSPISLHDDFENVELTDLTNRRHNRNLCDKVNTDSVYRLCIDSPHSLLIGVRQKEGCTSESMNGKVFNVKHKMK